MILKGQNVLILSDKKEALDVVEGKLNDVISKVRGSDVEYVNPILRLGKTDSNFSNIIKRSSIDKLKTSVKQFKAKQTQFQSDYDGIKDNLTTNVNNTIDALQSIQMSEIKSFHEQENALLDKYPVLADIPESVDDQIKLIADIHQLVQKYREVIAQVIGDEPKDINQNILNYIAFLPPLNDLASSDLNLLNKYPKLHIDKVGELSDTINDIIDAKIPVFGYLFSGRKVREYAKSIEAITGVYLEKPQIHINELRELIALPESLRIALSCYHLASASMSDFCNLARIGVMDNDSANLLQTFITAEFHESVAEAFPTQIENHLTVAPSNIMLLNEFRDFAKLRASLKDKFDSVPEFDYLGDKSQFEQMNTLKLVQQIDQRVTDFATNHKASAKTLQQIIRQKAKFPTDKFDLLREAFPCMIAGLRDFAEYIPLDKDLFDLIVIDEASQVSIAQALPALLRAKKVLVLGDRRQFGNVKTANASKKINEGYFKDVMNAFKNYVDDNDLSQETRLSTFNISHSVMDFFEMTNNFSIQLKKHFRGYPELISLSSKFFYDDSLQALKVRGKPIGDVLEFLQCPDLERIETHRNVNEQEADIIFEQILNMLANEGELPSVAIITPFRDQVTYLQRRVSEMPEREVLQKRLKLAIFTMDTCQGEERDHIYYSLVANRAHDGINYILPKELKVSEDEVDGKLKMQRVNVAFSRAKEKMIFVHSKPIDEFAGSARLILQHYQSVKEVAKTLPTNEQTDSNSPMEKKLLEWMKSTAFVSKHAGNLEIIPQFELGKYLKSLNPTYQHPAYKVDFLLRLTTQEDKIIQAIIEYDGFEFHFDMTQRRNIQTDNWQSYLTAGDVERECVLESFGYKMLRINRFNITTDPVSMLDEKLNDLFDEYLTSDEEHEFISGMNKTIEAIDSGEMKACSNCGQAKPLESFKDSTLKSGVGRKCLDCKGNKKSPASQGWRKPRRRRWY
jgi:very-short-patch-repair endonuclease